MWRKPLDEVLVRAGEGPAGLPVQAHQPPAGVAGPQHGTPFVAEAERLEQVPVPALAAR